MLNHAEGMPLSVVYRDNALLLIDKPSGMLVHRGWGKDPVVLVDQVRNLLGGGTVHPIGRLDRGSSGLVLFALSKDSASRINTTKEQRKIVKRYVALVRGRPPQDGIIDHAIPNKPGGPRVAARSSFRLLETVEIEPRAVSLVVVETRSGRFHQVRRHMKHIDHPLIGDANYGKGKLNRAIAESFGLNRLALHASELEMIHPTSLQPIGFRAPLPPDLCAALSRMGFRDSQLGG